MENTKHSFSHTIYTLFYLPNSETIFIITAEAQYTAFLIL